MRHGPARCTSPEPTLHLTAPFLGHVAELNRLKHRQLNLIFVFLPSCLSCTRSILGMEPSTFAPATAQGQVQGNDNTVAFLGPFNSYSHQV